MVTFDDQERITNAIDNAFERHFATVDANRNTVPIGEVIADLRDEVRELRIAVQQLVEVANKMHDYTVKQDIARRAQR